MNELASPESWAPMLEILCPPIGTFSRHAQVGDERTGQAFELGAKGCGSLRIEGSIREGQQVASVWIGRVSLEGPQEVIASLGWTVAQKRE